MADWTKPTITETYTDRTTQVKDRDDDAVRLNDTRAATASNLPTYAKRWNNTLGVFQAWVSSAWGALVLAVAGGGTGSTTASGARTNLGVYSTTQTDSVADGKITTHNAVTDAHGATAAASPNKIVLRGANASFYVPQPTTAAEVASKSYVDGRTVSGTYTPTATIVSNLDSCTPYSCNYIRVGDIVFVTGYMLVDATSTTGTATVRLSLPIASNLTITSDLSGVVGGATTSGAESGPITGHTTTDSAYVTFIPSVATSHGIAFSFAYKVL